MASYRSLKAWQVAHQLARAVTAATRTFPKHDRFELTSHLRRAAMSAPANLAEGAARFGRRELLRHARKEEGYLDQATYERLERLRREASFFVHRLIKAMHQDAE